MLPIASALLIVSIFLLITGSSALAPMIYAIF